MMNKANSILMLLCLGLHQTASATDFDGTKNLICAPINAVECVAGKVCQGGAPEDINLPQFVRVDAQKLTISGVRPDGTKANSKIENMRVIDGTLIMQGMENGRGWSISISQDNGKMIGAASGNQVGFIVYGACTVL